LITPFQLEESAKAPWTSTSVGFSTAGEDSWGFELIGDFLPVPGRPQPSDVTPQTGHFDDAREADAGISHGVP
jgi:hypothetical protein